MTVKSLVDARIEAFTILQAALGEVQTLQHMTAMRFVTVRKQDSGGMFVKMAALEKRQTGSKNSNVHYIALTSCAQTSF